MAWIDALFHRMVEVGASDLHMTSGLRPLFRQSGEMTPIDGAPVIGPDEMRQVLYEITPERNRAEFRRALELDPSHPRAAGKL